MKKSLGTAMMLLSQKLMQHSVNVVLFTRPNCALCESAKVVVQSVLRVRSFEYSEVNVMSPGQESWRRLYEFDTPVVRPKFKASFYDPSNFNRFMSSESLTPMQNPV